MRALALRPGNGRGGPGAIAWAPDGSAVVFSGMRVVNLDGSGLRQLTDEAVRDGRYAWAPAP